MSLVKRQRVDVDVTGAVVLEGHSGPVLGTRFSRDGAHLVSGGHDKSILLWNVPSDSEDDNPNFGVILGHKSAVTAVRWCHDELRLLSSSADGTIGFWDTYTGERVRKGKGHDGVVNEVDSHVDGLALSVGDDGNAFIWDQREKAPIKEVKTEYPLLTGAFNNKGNTFYIGGIEPLIKAFDLRRTDEPLWKGEGQNDSITSISVSNDDSTIASRTMDGVIRMYNGHVAVSEGSTRLLPSTLEGAPSGSEFYLIRTCFSNDDIKMCSGSEDKTLTIWDYKAQRVTNKFEGHMGTVVDVDYHPTNPIASSASTDGTIIVRQII